MCVTENVCLFLSLPLSFARFDVHPTQQQHVKIKFIHNFLLKTTSSVVSTNQCIIFIIFIFSFHTLHTTNEPLSFFIFIGLATTTTTTKKYQQTTKSSITFTAVSRVREIYIIIKDMCRIWQADTRVVSKVFLLG